MGSGFDLQLTSLMDALVIIVIFLLKSYTTSQQSMTEVKGVDLPKSNQSVLAVERQQIIITREAILVDQKPVYSFADTANFALPAEVLDPKDGTLRELRDLLVKLKANAPQSQTEELNTLAIQATKEVPYRILRLTMLTAARAGYSDFSLIARKTE